MAVVSVQVTEHGFRLSEESVRELGLQPGEEVRLDIRRVADAQTVETSALRYIWRKLGDAVGVAPPVWNGNGWTVPLWVKGRQGTFGELVLSPAGEVLAERSTSKQQLLAALENDTATISALQATGDG